jgi:putative hydrolase of the HAD superfamily
MKPAAAICFDFDGTLAEFRGDFSEFLDELRLNLNLLQCDFRRFRDELAAQLSKPGAVSLSAALAGTLRRLERRELIDAALVKEALTAYAARVQLLPGAGELLQTCARHLPLALISNGPADMQRAAISGAGIAGFFAAILISGDEDIAVRKPDPHIFGLAASRLGVQPADILMVGDDPVADILGAQSAGFRVLHVRSGSGAAAARQEILAFLPF